MKYVTTLLVLLFTLIGISTQAQTAKVIGINEAIEIAQKYNDLDRSKLLEIQSIYSLRKTAYEIPKLQFNAELGNYNGPRFDQSFQISQTIPFPTLFKAKKDLNTIEVEDKVIARQISELEIKNEVRTYFYQIQYLQHNQKKLYSLDSLYNDFIRVVKLRYKVGDIKKMEINLAEAKKNSIYLLYQQNDIYLKNAYQNLRTVMNSPEPFAVEDPAVYQPLFLSNLIDPNSITENPSIKALYQDALIAEENKKVEKAKNLPDLTLGYTNQSLIGNFEVKGQEVFYDSGKRFHSVMVGVSIPIFSTSRSKIESLDYSKKAAEANAEYQKKKLATQYENALQQYELEVQQFQYYVNVALPSAKEIISATQLGYRLGEITSEEYLFGLQTASDIEINYLKSIQEINQSVILIYSLINQ